MFFHSSAEITKLFNWSISIVQNKEKMSISFNAGGKKFQSKIKGRTSEHRRKSIEKNQPLNKGGQIQDDSNLKYLFCS